MNQITNYNTHPISFINNLKQAYGNRLILRFSKYTYIPNSRLDNRDMFTVGISEVTKDWLNNELLNLKKNQDLALDSLVSFQGEKRKRHIPMLDFRGMTKGQLTAIMDVFPKDFQESLYVYFSGRSFHAYFTELLTHSNWVKFMGSSLLCNTKNDPSVVDQRWVGHRLIAGYSTLRWSANGAKYKGYPTLVDPSDLEVPYNDKKWMLDLHK